MSPPPLRSPRQKIKHHASPAISSEGVHRTYIRPVFGLNSSGWPHFLSFTSIFSTRTGSFFTNSYLHASSSILIAMLAKFIVVFLALSTFANAAPAMRTSKLVPCIVDAPAHLFSPQVEAYPSPLMVILSTCEIWMQHPP